MNCDRSALFPIKDLEYFSREVVGLVFEFGFINVLDLMAILLLLIRLYRMISLDFQTQPSYPTTMRYKLVLMSSWLIVR
jgi:hypothetical protein